MLKDYVRLTFLKMSIQHTILGFEPMTLGHESPPHSH